MRFRPPHPSHRAYPNTFHLCCDLMKIPKRDKYFVIQKRQNAVIIYIVCKLDSWVGLTWVGTFIIDAELTTVATSPDGGIYETQLYNQHTSAGRRGSWAGAWMKIATVMAVGGLAVVGSRFCGHRQRSCVGRSMTWSRVPWQPQTPQIITACQFVMLTNLETCRFSPLHVLYTSNDFLGADRLQIFKFPRTWVRNVAPTPLPSTSV